jgi:arsenite methyltransferase
MNTSADALREEVRSRYAAAALGIQAGAGCGCDCESIGCCGEDEATLFGQGLYAPEVRGALPDGAVGASLGCGNPIALAELRRGEVVLDLGSGGGLDVISRRSASHPAASHTGWT